jgi:hypothetical protein
MAALGAFVAAVVAALVWRERLRQVALARADTC